MQKKETSPLSYTQQKTIQNKDFQQGPELRKISRRKHGVNSLTLVLVIIYWIWQQKQKKNIPLGLHKTKELQYRKKKNH